MRHMAKRTLSLFLALLLCLTLFPTAALAEEGTIRPVEDGENGGLSGMPAPTEEGKPGTIVGDGVLDVPSDDPAALSTEPAVDEVQGIVASGACGENLTWTLDDAGVLSISGTGDMAYWFPESNVPWYSYRETISKIVLPEGLTSIGRLAFCSCKNVSSLMIPARVTSIGKTAFGDCISLISLTIPAGVTIIENSTFAGCTSLKSVTIPESVTSIGYRAFSGCSHLTSITIPSRVTGIGNEAFYDCSSLTNVTITEGVTSIGDNTFVNCSSLTSVTIPVSVTSIGRNVFFGCSNLTSVTMPSSLTSIGYLAFCHCSSLTSVTISEGVTNIGEEAFSYCSSLQRIFFLGDAPALGSGLFRGDQATALYPIDNATWTADKLQDYGAEKLTWVGYRDEARAYTIHFDPNGGINAPEDQIKGHNVDITLTDAVPGRENAAFLGWSTRRGAAEPDYLPGDSFGLNVDTTLYAVWKLEAPVLPTEAVLSLGSAKVCAGQEFTVKLTMEKNPGLMYLSFRLDYDAASLEFLGAEDGVFTGWTVNREKSFLAWDADGDRTENGALLHLRFRAKEEARTGETPIALAELFATNYEEELLGIGSVPGTVTILPHTPGDVNGDGEVDGRDLVRLRKYLAGVPEIVIVEANANVNGDDVVDILDLIRLRKYLAQDKVILE